MTTLMVSYDLNRTGQNYAQVISALKEKANWWHCLDSTWLVTTTQTAAQLRDELLGYIDSNDKLLVIDVTGDSAGWYGFQDSESQWIHDHL